ncbi:deoxyribonuclease IV [Candidatus Roizmanbacteria bacterium]|nr:deoxyribonuclease IV [Candidatus Roizmanbacteria bacterium]
MLLGAHLSVAGGYTKALQKINAIGGNCLQIFSASPRGWHFADLSPAVITEFAAAKKQKQIDPVYFHASYLINLAANNRVSQLSKQSLKHELKVASRLGIQGTIVHLGSFKKDITKEPLPYENYDWYGDLVVNIKEILDETPSDTYLMIENAGNNKIGKDFGEIATIITSVNNPRLRVCLDTCHLYSAGYDLSSTEKLEAFLISFDSLIGLEKLAVMHFNDSRDPLGAGRDRHENIGQGTVPIDTFRLLMTHRKTRHLPFIIETPGFDDKGPDKKNLDILKNLVSHAKT